MTRQPKQNINDQREKPYRRGPRNKKCIIFRAIQNSYAKKKMRRKLKAKAVLNSVKCQYIYNDVIRGISILLDCCFCCIAGNSGIQHGII